MVGQLVHISVTLTASYRPAWFFADAAARWVAECGHLDVDAHVPEAAHLALLYSAMSLEALIAQTLDDESGRIQVDDLFDRRISVANRWRQGAARLAVGTADSQAAAAEVGRECQDRGSLGLLLRARNKLVHGRVCTEVFDANGHSIQDGSIERLVRDLQAAPANLPVTRPAFPNIIQCRAAAEWARSVLGSMTRLLHRVSERPIDEQWLRVLPP